MNAYLIWLYLIPTWLLGFLIVGSLTALSVAGLYLVRPWVSRHRHPGNDVVFSFAGATGVIYALVLGLFAVATWDSLKAAEDIASKEAFQIGKLNLDLSGYANEDRDHLRPMLKQYLERIINVEWPMQRRGLDADDPPVLSEMMTYWLRVEPKTEGQRVVHGEALGQLNELLSLRRARQAAVHSQLPPPMWAVVILGAILNIGISYLITTEHTTMHALMVGFLAAMIGVMIYVIVAVDHPMWGAVSVGTESYQGVLTHMGSWRN